MNFTRNQTVIVAVIVLVVISLATFGMAKMADNKEKNAAEAVSKMYKETMIPVNSTVGMFGDEFKLTVQSEETKNVYDFDVNGEEITSTYYNENINVELSKIIEATTESFALVNATMPALTEATPIADADIAEIHATLITPKSLEQSTADQIAKFLKEAAGNVPITLDVLVVESEEDYNGVTFEVKNFFQRSTVTKDSFNSLKYEEQLFKFES